MYQDKDIIIIFHGISNAFINKRFCYTTGGSKSDAESIKAKNIMQTELMIRLRDAILRVSRYFQVRKYKNFNIIVLLETSYFMHAMFNLNTNYVTNRLPKNPQYPYQSQNLSAGKIAPKGQHFSSR